MMYIIFSRFRGEAFDRPELLFTLVSRIAERVRQECPKVTWRTSWSIRDPSAMVDIVEAEDPSEVLRAVMIIRSLGGVVTTDTLYDTRWAECLE